MLEKAHMNMDNNSRQGTSICDVCHLYNTKFCEDFHSFCVKLPLHLQKAGDSKGNSKCALFKGIYNLCLDVMLIEDSITKLHSKRAPIRPL